MTTRYLFHGIKATDSFLFPITDMRGIALLAMIAVTEMKEVFVTTAATTTNP